MKLINETAARGKHGVLFHAESEDDQEFNRAVFTVLSRAPVFRAQLEQPVGDEFQSLRLEEKE
jgi:hypothetical protein